MQQMALDTFHRIDLKVKSNTVKSPFQCKSLVLKAAEADLKKKKSPSPVFLCMAVRLLYKSLMNGQHKKARRKIKLLL